MTGHVTRRSAPIAAAEPDSSTSTSNDIWRNIRQLRGSWFSCYLLDLLLDVGHSWVSRILEDFPGKTIKPDQTHSVRLNLILMTILAFQLQPWHSFDRIQVLLCFCSHCIVGSRDRRVSRRYALLVCLRLVLAFMSCIFLSKYTACAYRRTCVRAILYTYRFLPYYFVRFHFYSYISLDENGC